MRARWLKPEFFTDKKIAGMGPIAALVYQALWCMADDGGTAPCDADTVKAQMFYRWSAVGVPEISEALWMLSKTKRITRYAVGDDHYARIESWDEHQQVHKPSKFRHPPMSQGVVLDDAGEVPEQCGTGEAPLPAAPPPRYLDSQTPRHLDTKTPPRSPRKAARTEEIEREFGELWPLYPKRAGSNPRSKAFRAYCARRDAGVAFEVIRDGLLRYAAFLRATDKIGTPFVMQGATFFGPDAHYAEPWTPPPTETGAARRGPLVSVTEEAAQRQKLADALEQRYAAERKRIGVRWAHEHPDEYEPIRAEVEELYSGQSGAFIAKAKEIELAQRCAAAAGFQSFDEWLATNNPPQAGAA